MRTSSSRTFCQFALFLLLVLTVLTPAVYAQEPIPNTTPSTAQPQELLDAERYNPDAATPTAEGAADGTSGETQSPDAVDVTEESEAEPPSTEALPEYSPTPLEGTTTSDFSTAAIQGVITLDVSAPDTVRAGNPIDYTYAYKNNSGTTASGVEIEAVWSNFKVTKDNAAWQWCGPENCGVQAGSVQGPAVTVISGPSASGVRFRIGQLAPGESGRFSVRLISNPAIYPKTGQPVTRPASSAKLYNGSTTPISEDTANTMVVGPVFNLTKAAVTTTKIYPGETAEFVIRVGNATGSGDSVNGQVRADAIDATNVVISDNMPSGGEFVSATPAPVDPTSTTLSWQLGNLPVGQTKEIRVVFRKADVKSDCNRLNNATYNVTSAEMPANLTVAGKAASVDTVIPMAIKSLTASPSAIVYGAEATLTIVVQNFYNKNLSGVRLNYDIQNNVYYIAGSANPTASASPDSTQLGGRLTWTFDMPAGSKTTPTERTFTLRVRANYTSSSNRGSAYAQIIPPVGVPSACIAANDTGVKVDPRLSLTKTTDASPETKINNNYIVERGSTFWYMIDVTNNGPADATDVNVYDALPKEDGANFSYVGGSATMNGQPRAPDTATNGQNGTLIWNNLSIPSGTTVRLRYALKVNGLDYVTYCNYATAEKLNEQITHITSQRKVCVKINPQIHVTKTANKKAVGPGEEVQFTLTLTNRESYPYRVGLYDLLGSFTFVRQERGYAEPQPVSGGLTWPLVDLPPGEQISAVIVAKVPTNCVNKSYDNEVLFRNDTHLIQPVPRVKASVAVFCSLLEYSKIVDRSPVSLQDRMVYTISVRNANTSSPINNVTVDDILPQGFSYVGMEGTSVIKSAPAQTMRSDGRPKLTWNIPSIASNTTVTIKFIARSGNTIGTYENWVTASAPEVLGVCKGTCISQTENGTPVEYSVRAVTVQPLITIAPEINPDTCTQPGQSRTYRLSVVNTNNHLYSNTTVKAALPFGLQYVRPLGTTPMPAVNIDNAGVTTIQWSNLTIPAKPKDAFAAQVVLEVEVLVGHVWGNLITVEQATSPDGLIPRKDGVQNAIVRVCATSPAIAKDVNHRAVRAGSEVLYQISLANPTDRALDITVEDHLPAGMSFVQMVAGPAPSVNNSTLRWNVTVPAATNGQAGHLILQFKARTPSGNPGTKLTNTAQVVASSTPFNATYNSVTVDIVVQLYIPLLQR
jgi:uncharacterized repeat protein (TIGR01451 family)